MAPSGSDPSVYDHLRPRSDTEDDELASSVDPGVYRVIGTDESNVTLLRVGDADSYRINTGHVVTVGRDSLDGLDPAENPDGNRPLSEKARQVLTSLGWNLRAFVAGLRARPVGALVALSLVVVGHQGHRLLVVPDRWLTAVYFLGVLGVVYLGSRGG